MKIALAALRIFEHLCKTSFATQSSESDLHPACRELTRRAKSRQSFSHSITSSARSRSEVGIVGLIYRGLRWGYPRAPILSCVLVSPSYELVPKHTQVPPNARVCRENAFAHPHFPPRLIISRIPTRQIQGRDVSMRIQRATGGTQGKSLRPLTVYKNVFEPIARGATFRDPHPAFSAAICVQLSVAGAASDSSRQTH
jgi:hypothetical protein